MELRLVIGQLEEFAKRVSQELQEPDWDTRREVVRALVKKVEIDEQEVRIVYRVSPSPFEGGPQQGSLQHCWGRARAALRNTPGRILPGSRRPARAGGCEHTGSGLTQGGERRGVSFLAAGTWRPGKRSASA